MSDYFDTMEHYDKLLDLIEHHVDEIVNQTQQSKEAIKLIVAQRIFEDLIVMTCQNSAQAESYLEHFCEDFTVYIHNKEWNQIH